MKEIMKIRFTHWALSLLSIYILAGCASPVSGHRLADEIQPIRKLSFVVQYGKSKNENLAHDFYMNELLSRLSNRVPLMLAINGIETERTETRYDLVLGPRSVRTYTRSNGSMFVEMNLTAFILDKAAGSKRIWEGELIYVSVAPASMSDSSIDAVTKEFLEKLAEDKVLSLQASAINLPNASHH
jgi:hypothetical protein